GALGPHDQHAGARPALGGRMLTTIGERAARWVDSFDPFTNVYGVARSLLALSTALTLLFTRPDVLFRPAAGIDAVPRCGGARSLSTFCVGAPHLELVRWASVVVRLLVVLGYRPRVTGVLHAWVAFGLQASAITIEGGDQIAAILALLLVPV